MSDYLTGVEAYELDAVEAVLDAEPSSSDVVYKETIDLSERAIAAVAAKRAGGGGDGGSQSVVENPGNTWAAETSVPDGYRIAVDLADSPTGDFLGVFEVTTAGTTGTDEPTWRTGLGGEFVTDDSAVWRYIGQIGRFPIALVGAPTEYLSAGELRVGSTGTVQTDGVADTAQRATVYGDGNATASLSGYAGTGAVDVDSSGSTGGDGSVDASHTATVGGDGIANGKCNAVVQGDGDADASVRANVVGDGDATAVVVAEIGNNASGTATAGFKATSLALGLGTDTIGLVATAVTGGDLQLLAIGIPTADPLVAGAIWSDGGVLTVSAG